MNTIVEKIAKEQIVESIIANVAKNSKDEDLRDLANDIYLELLEKPAEILEGIYDREQMNYYITRIVMNNINSKTSRFYYKYRLPKQKEVSIDDPNISLNKPTDYGQRAEYD